MAYFNLHRRFVERKTYDASELVAAEVRGRRLSWDEVVANTPCVVVAPANFGKTTEMRERAKYLRRQSEHTAFVVLHQIAARGSVEQALERDELAAYQAWQASPGSQLTLFVDSLDEAAASTRDGIEYLLTRLAEDADWPSPNVRWVLSTRPAVLNDSIYSKLKELLGASVVTTAASTSAPPADPAATSARASTHPTAPAPSALRLYSMAELDTRQATAYLNGRHPAMQANDVLRVSRERGLVGFTYSPGGLDILAHINLIGDPPSCLTEVFSRVTDAVALLRGGDTRLQATTQAAESVVHDAASRLASASQVCQLMNVEMPSDTLDIPKTALSARLIANPFLSDAATAALLSTQIFIDVGLSQVKMYPDELTPFLAARRLSTLVQSESQAKILMQSFSWRSSTGEMGVHRQFLPLMGWLATLNKDCRKEILQVDPHALALFGDLRNSSVPLRDAEAALTSTILRQVELGERPGRGQFYPTSENYWQAGSPRLERVISALYRKHSDDHWARETLTAIATASRSPILREQVLKRHARQYTNVLHDNDDLRYLLELGLPEDLKQLASAVAASHSATDSAVARVIEGTGWAYLTPTAAARLVARQMMGESEGFNTGYMLESSTLLDSATDAQLYEFCRALVERLPTELRDSGEGRSDGERLIEKTIHSVSRLVARVPSHYSQETADLCITLQAMLHELGMLPNLASLQSAFVGNTALRRRLLQTIAQQGQGKEQTLQRAFGGYDRLANFTEADVIQVADAELIRAYSDYMRSQTSELPRTSPGISLVKKDRFAIEPETTTWLQDHLESLRDGTNEQGLTWLAGWLMLTTKHSRYGEVDFMRLESRVGADIAGAARDGLSKAWRHRPPLSDEAQPSATYHITIAGLQGLHLELGDGKSLPPLTEAEVRRALRYGVFELNGLPKWFWPLAAANQATANDELLRIAGEWGNGPVSKAHAENLLMAAEVAPIGTREKLANFAWTYLLSGSVNSITAERLLQTVLSKPMSLPATVFELRALTRIQAAFSPRCGAGPVDQASLAIRAEATTWGAKWLSNFPASFRSEIHAWGQSDGDSARAFVYALASYLGRDRQSDFRRLAQASNDGVWALEGLCQWTRWAVDPADDYERPEGKLFSPNSREHAQRMRDGLVDAIASADSQYAYEALERLHSASHDVNFKQYLRYTQLELRERQLQRAPIHQRSYDLFEKSLQTDVTDFTSLAMAVESDIRAVQYDIEHGEFSLRSLFSTVDFVRANMLGVDGKKAGLALEETFQRLLASELNHYSNKRYTVTLESQTAESNRRDVLCSRYDWRASIELKMSARWTLEDYFEALEEQLVGQYMHHYDASAGFLVVVLQTVDREWIEKPTGRKLSFQDVLAVLASRARDLESKNPSLYLRVIGIDATTKQSFRAKKAATTAKTAARVTAKQTHLSKKAGARTS